MARLPPGRVVVLREEEQDRLRFPPPSAEVVIAVHPGALKAPASRLTLAAWLDGDDELGWIGAIDERMVLGQLGRTTSPRTRVGRALFRGARCWSIVWPGHLVRSHVPTPYHTVYAEDRPWIVLGELSGGSLVAAPLNDARGNPKWYAPRIDRRDLDDAAKDGQLEMAHLWSFPPDLAPVGAVRESARPGLRDAIASYYA